AHADADVLRQHHERLAHALEASHEAAPEVLALHWRAAGDANRAYHHALLAAEQAANGLAFARAARLYGLCVELRGPGAPEIEDLQLKVADALAHSGRGADAAAAYLAAAALGGPRALEARRCAAERLLTSGDFDQGMNVLRHLLADVGMSLA